jgi:2-oxoacid:acceptor oxidoreductase gamma subunit (pyruvate/2-ketoisovalerate family)
VTASRILATAALKGGYYLQSLPDFGAERSGAPISAHTRIDESPPIDRGPIGEPDVIIVLDMSLIGQVDMLAGLAGDGVVIINTPDPESSVIQRLELAADQELWTIDGSGIGMAHIGRNLPNTPVLGAFARAVPVLELATVSAALEELMSETFNKKIVDSNLDALRAGFEQVTQRTEVKTHA